MARLNFSAANPRKPNSVASRGCGVLFGLVFLATGCLFTVFVAKEFIGTARTRSWEKVPATLTKAEVKVGNENSDQPFELVATFDYQFEGRRYMSSRYAREATLGNKYEKLALKAKALRERRDLVAYVDPDSPGEAVLARGSLWFGVVILFPLLFVAIGGGIVYASLRNWKKRPPDTVESISSSPTGSQSKAGERVGLVLGLVFFAVGVGLIYPLGVKPMMLSTSAKNWPAVPCEVTWAKVRSHKGDDSTTYSVDIFYRYEFEGRQHQSNRFSFSTGSSSGRGSKQKIVDRYKAMGSPVCYVDPSLPERAVLERKLGASAFLALIPIIAGSIGAWILVHSLGAAREGKSDSSPSPFHASDNGAAPRTLSPGKSRLGALIILLLVGLFWNGMVFGLLFPEAWVRGEGGLFLKLFSIPFILVGIGIAVGFVYTLLAFFNPKPIITLEPGEPKLGEPVSFRWEVKGPARRIRRFQIVLKGIERATFQRGTDTITVEDPFYAESLIDLSGTSAIGRGTATFTVPGDLMYSFDAGNNEIAWRIEIKGDVPRWPDISDKFDINVTPPQYS